MAFTSLFFSIVLFSIVFADENENARILNDQTSLLVFVSGVTSDPGNVLQNWTSSSQVHFCNWTGITCNADRDSVLELDLSGASLHGSISPAISKLSRLTVLDLSRNFFEGEIPLEIGYLLELKQLSLSSNLLRGKIPFEIGFLLQLQYLDLGSNKLVGEIPTSLFCNGSSALEYVDISNNSISGQIPLKEECEVQELRFLLVWSNKLSGRVPRALSNSTKLKWLDLESNFLEGELPFEIVKNLSNLQFVYLSYNRFSGPLKPFFSALSNSQHLQELELAGNRLYGKIPDIIGNLSKSLVQLHLDDNKISGGIPPDISYLLNLTLLNLSSNFLNLTIPHELFQMRKLERLYLSDNSLSGEIPPDFGNGSRLGLLDLSKNRLSGSIPETFSSLSQLRRLLLHNNRLVGTIPTSLAQCVNLEILDLSHNQISGSIPSDFARLNSLKLYLNISYNQLDGFLPSELSKMNMVLAMDLSSNNFSGGIPAQLGSCIALELLNLSGNSFEGPLPDSIGNLPFLETFDVSRNILSGKIPESFPTSLTLKQLNFSFNNFSGNTSFPFLSIDSFLGNPQLCSSSIVGIPICKNKRKKNLIRLPILLTILAIATFLMSMIPVVFKSKSKRKFSKIFSRKLGCDEEDEEQERKEQSYPKISRQELIEATGGFNGSNLIGSGRFGQVYKGVLKDNTRVAVKVICYAKTDEIVESFKKECEVLRNTRHRNLIRIITICSRPDFKALVLPLMQNGSLEDHLYPSDGLISRVDLVQMVRICSDVAEALAYLHHYAPVKVAHCDLKPSNILLDDDMNALVSDFGIAKLVKDEVEKIPMTAGGSPSVTSTDGLLCGSIGYIAPEYGMGRRASTQGDVYSFGVLLLEMVTRKRPTDMVFHEGSSLHEWVKSKYPHKLEPIVKEALKNYTPVTTVTTPISCSTKLLHDMVLELIELGLICTQYNPSTRPTMLDVAHEMATWKEYLFDPSNRSIE